MELKRVAYGVIMAATLIFVRFIDHKIYDMPIFVSVLVVIGIMVLSYKLVDRFAFFDRKISRNTYYLLNSVIISLLIITFYLIES